MKYKTRTIQGLGVLSAACGLGALACSSSDSQEPTQNTQSAGGTGGQSTGGTGGQSAGGAGGQSTGGTGGQSAGGTGGQSTGGAAGQSTGGAGGEGTPGCDSSLQIFFSPMYSAFIDGTRAFEIPAIVNGVSNANVTWSADPPNLVALDPRPELLMIRTQGAGTVAITARAADHCGNSQLTISQATAAQWEAGNARYNNGVPLPPVPNPPIPPADGSNPLEANGVRPACASCHSEAAAPGIFKSFTYTPQQIGGYSDEEIVQVLTKGVIPAGGYYNTGSGIPQAIWSFFHRWTLSAEEARGLVVYLRSLPPKSMGGSF